MRTQTSQNIIKYLAFKKQVSAKELSDYLGISRQALYKHLVKLIEEGKINKRGKPPVVFYFIPPEKTYQKEIATHPTVDFPLIERNYLLITPAGERLEGMNGFAYWCNKNNLPHKIYYFDFYSIERFGKTKLGSLLLYAKQSQNKSLMAELTRTVKSKTKTIILKHKIGAVGFIPPTVKREIQSKKDKNGNYCAAKNPG